MSDNPPSAGNSIKHITFLPYFLIWCKLCGANYEYGFKCLMNVSYIMSVLITQSPNKMLIIARISQVLVDSNKQLATSA